MYESARKVVRVETALQNPFTLIRSHAHASQMLQAVVGLKRLDALDRQVRSKLLQVTNSGKHEALHMFKGTNFRTFRFFLNFMREGWSRKFV